jgi:hypothetical protein
MPMLSACRVQRSNRRVDRDYVGEEVPQVPPSAVDQGHHGSRRDGGWHPYRKSIHGPLLILVERPCGPAGDWHKLEGLVVAAAEASGSDERAGLGFPDVPADCLRMKKRSLIAQHTCVTARSKASIDGLPVTARIAANQLSGWTIRSRRFAIPRCGEPLRLTSQTGSLATAPGAVPCWAYARLDRYPIHCGFSHDMHPPAVESEDAWLVTPTRPWRPGPP